MITSQSDLWANRMHPPAAWLQELKWDRNATTVGDESNTDLSRRSTVWDHLSQNNTFIVQMRGEDREYKGWLENVLDR